MFSMRLFATEPDKSGNYRKPKIEGKIKIKQPFFKKF